MKSTNHLFKKYLHHSNENLIAIVENPNLYQKETVEVAKELLEGRAPDQASIQDCARQLMHKRLKIYFGNFSIWNDELEIPTSEFLLEKEVQRIFEIEYDNFLELRMDFGLDMNQYQAV
jgi:hypothetical protein